MVLLFLFLCWNPALSHAADAVSDQNNSQEVQWEEYLKDPTVGAWVSFWMKIYSETPNSKGFIHDANYPELIYETVDTSGLTDRNAQRFVKNRKKYWIKLLDQVHHKTKKSSPLTDEERELVKKFETISEPNKFLAAKSSKRIRYQKGQKDSFESALKASGKYLPILYSIFKDAGMPRELAILPFVESSFNLKARSKVGASGVWQFMRSTGRLFLIMNPYIDERNDPILATRAAAKLLKRNYDILERWPLAVLAYNHGAQGVKRAVSRVGSNDIGEIIRNYRSRSFQFASKNFFMEFLAAVMVERNHEQYFGSVEREDPLSYAEVTVPDSISVPVLIEQLVLDKELFLELNAGLSKKVIAGKLRIPPNFRLKLPTQWGQEAGGSQKKFLEVYDSIPKKYKFRRS